MRSLNFSIRLDALFESKKDVSTSDIVKAVRASMRERALIEGPEEESKNPANKWSESRVIVGPNFKKPIQLTSTILVRQYRYRNTPISLSQSTAGKWTGAIGFLFRKMTSPTRSISSIVETLPYDAEKLALSDAVELVDETLKSA